MAVYSRIEDLIGDTPTLDVSSLSPNPAVRIYAKLEGQNPAGSVKDRAARAIFLDAIENGHLEGGRRLIDAGSAALSFSLTNPIGDSFILTDSIAGAGTYFYDGARFDDQAAL